MAGPVADAEAAPVRAAGRHLAQSCGLVPAEHRQLEAVEVGPGAHCLQEDDPHGIGEAIAAWMRDEPRS